MVACTDSSIEAWYSRAQAMRSRGTCVARMTPTRAKPQDLSPARPPHMTLKSDGIQLPCPSKNRSRTLGARISFGDGSAGSTVGEADVEDGGRDRDAAGELDLLDQELLVLREELEGLQLVVHADLLGAGHDAVLAAGGARRLLDLG